MPSKRGHSRPTIRCSRSPRRRGSRLNGSVERMNGNLTIRGDLEHDGDGVVRIHFAARNENFSGTTAAWAADTQVAEFASVLLAGFPSTTPSEATYSFGSPKSGQCHFRFVTIDNVGHCAAWVEIISEDAAYAGDEFESSLVCLKFTAAALDRFCLQLSEFTRGRDNAATLSEDGALTIAMGSHALRARLTKCDALCSRLKRHVRR